MKTLNEIVKIFKKSKYNKQESFEEFEKRIENEDIKIQPHIEHDGAKLGIQECNIVCNKLADYMAR